MNLPRITAAIAASMALIWSPLSSADGKAVFEKSCAGCHKAMSPKLTEKDKWAPILKQGTNAMVASVVKGKGVMPPRGGAASNDDVKAAIEYLQTLVK